MPLRWLRCCVAMYGRLQAEEALAGVAVARAGDPWTDAKVARKIVGGWQDALPREPAKRDRLTPEQFMERMQMLGMEMVNGPENYRQ